MSLCFAVTGILMLSDVGMAALTKEQQKVACSKSVSSRSDPNKIAEKLLLRIEKHAEVLPEGDAELVVSLWFSYELKRRPHEGQIPSTKKNDWLRTELIQFFRGQRSKRSTRRFFSLLKQKDMDLYEFAVLSKEDAVRTKEEEALDFNPEETIRQWQEFFRSHSECPFPTRIDGNRLNQTLWRVIKGKVDSDLAFEFLCKLNRLEPRLFEALLQEFENYVAPPKPAGTPNNDRWVIEWETDYRLFGESRYLPDLTTHADLRLAVQYYLTGASGPASQKRFMAELKRQDPLLHAYSVESSIYSTVNSSDSAGKFPKLSLAELVRQWSFYFRLKISEHPPEPQWDRNRNLYVFLRDVVRGLKHSEHIDTFFQKLQNENLFLFEYLFASAKECAQLRAEGIDCGAVRARNWAYQWSQYRRVRVPGESIVPTVEQNPNLAVNLGRYRRGEVAPGDAIIFDRTLEAIDPELAIYARTYFGKGAPLDPHVMNRSDYRRWAVEWDAYVRASCKNVPQFPKPRENLSLYWALRKYLDAQVSPDDLAGLLYHLKSLNSKLHRFALQQFKK